MWRLGFFFHEMAFGLLSIFLPLYVIAIGGSWLDVGILIAVALFLAIPASFLWGYLCDKTKHYKRYILLSFGAVAFFLYLFTFASSVALLIVLYALLSIFHVAHEAPKNVLIAESYPREKWEKAFAFYEGFTETGSLIGLFLGFLMSAYGVGAYNTLFVCSILNFIAFSASFILIADPAMIFERSLVNIEKTIDFAYHGAFLASRMLDGIPINEKLRRENVTAFCVGLVLFSFATSTLFTPMPIFVSEITKAAALPASLVFIIYVLNSGASVTGYFLAGRRSGNSAGKPNIARTAILRGVLSFLLIIALQWATRDILLPTAILILMGFAYAWFIVYTLSMSMELIPQGKAGLFNVLIGIGGACGSFIGPFIAQSFGFFYLFLAAGAVFMSAYIAFKIFV